MSLGMYEDPSSAFVTIFYSPVDHVADQFFVQAIGMHYPKLYLFALSIPQVQAPHSLATAL